MHYFNSAPVEDVKAIMQICKEGRAMNRVSNNGFSNDKGKTMRQTAKIPFGITVHPEYKKYFDAQMDVYERKKNYDRFFSLPEIEFIDENGQLVKCSPKVFLMVDKI